MAEGASVIRLRPLTRGLRLLAWTWALLVVAEVHRLCVPRSRRREVYDGYVRLWSKRVLTILGIEVHSAGDDDVGPADEGMPLGSPALIVANHRSALDIPILLARFGGVALSRGDLARWPVLGFAARRASTIFVDRGSTGSRAAAIRSIGDRVELSASSSPMVEQAASPDRC